MHVEKLNCPYCKKEQDPHSFGQLEELNTRNCQACGREFVFTVKVAYQTFIEADSSDFQTTEESSAVPEIKQAIEEKKVIEKKPVVKAYIHPDVVEKLNNWSANRGITKNSVYKSIAEMFKFSTGTITAMFNINMMATDAIMEEFYQTTGIRTELMKTDGKVLWCLVDDEPDTKSVVSHESEDTIHNTDGMTEFEYQFGYNIIKETRRIKEADIPAHITRLSKKAENRDSLTGKPKPWELLSINGVKVKKEQVA